MFLIKGMQEFTGLFFKIKNAGLALFRLGSHEKSFIEPPFMDKSSLGSLLLD